MASSTSLRHSSVTVRFRAYGDEALAAAAFGLSLVVMVHGGHFVSQRGPSGLRPAGVVLLGLSTLPLAAWRRSPFAILVVTGVANVALAAVVHPIGLPLGPAVAVYLLAASRTQASPPLARIVAVAGVLLAAYVAGAGFAEGTFPGLELLHGVLAWSAAWFAGERARLRCEQIEELKLEARRERLLATAEERARIARDLHDSAGHAISVIAVRAGAARLRHGEDPDRSLAALEAIEDLARRTVADIDRFVGALREPTTAGTVEAPARLTSLPALVAQRRAAGLEIVEATSGSPRSLPATLDQAAYRIVQEALTNAARHGDGTACLEVSFGDQGLDVRVTNPVAAGGAVRNSGGHGLVGMHERAALLGGSVEVEQHNGTFQLTAHLPYRSVAQ